MAGIGLADLVLKLGLSSVVILWVLFIFTRELREIMRLLQDMARTQAVLQKTLDALLTVTSGAVAAAAAQNALPPHEE